MNEKLRKIITETQGVVREQQESMAQSIALLRSQITAYRTQIQNMDAELNSCRTRDTRSTDDETTKIIADYEHLNQQLAEQLRESITDTEIRHREVTRDQQKTMELLHEMTGEIERNKGIEEKYVTLHVKHKKLQDTINKVYSKTTKHFERRRQTPSRPPRRPISQRQPFSRTNITAASKRN